MSEEWENVVAPFESSVLQLTTNLDALSQRPIHELRAGVSAATIFSLEIERWRMTLLGPCSLYLRFALDAEIMTPELTLIPKLLFSLS